jgi:hypothetical protein
VCGAAANTDDFRPVQWQLLVQELADRPAAEQWVKKNHTRFTELTHFAVDIRAPAGAWSVEWEVFDRDREGDLYSSRDGRRL